MAITVISVELVAQLGVLVRFSDSSFAYYSSEELLALRPVRKGVPPAAAN